MKQLSTINGLRGLSALWVVLAHCGIWAGYTRYNPNPKVAVDIFMMISGFLMMYTVELTLLKKIMLPIKFPGLNFLLEDFLGYHQLIMSCYY